MVKHRALAVELIEQGHVRLNKVRMSKAGHAVKPGDVLTVAIGTQIRVLKVKDVANRRGPYAEAVKLYDDLVPASSVPEKDGA
jgi:ribosome-associated heat shock protein Hsp15